MITVERADFVSVPVTDMGVCPTALLGDSDGDTPMLHRRYAPRED